MFNITSREQVILNTWYGGEMKKGMFSMMNYYLPLKGIASMHCSANTDMNGENTAIFFGLSGTGKTTLSTDPKRLLIGDDEHGWDDNGVFNFEGGCYAKVINLDKESEPDIYNAIKRNALLENVTLDENGKIDFADKSVTENTRVSYPIDHIEKIVRPVSAAPAAKNVIFLSADAFGVLPPVSILTAEQTEYYFLSGFTAKLAGTERGITEPTPTFSACFGQAFLELHPTKYAEELVKRMKQSGAKAYLVNTGWNGTGKRISIKDTRGIIDAILDGSIKNSPTKTIPYFNFEVPTELPGVDPAILDPRDTYANRPTGMLRPRISPPASRRTSSSTRATKPARRWSPLARSCKECGRGSSAPPPLPPPPNFARAALQHKRNLQGSDFCSGKWDFPTQKSAPEPDVHAVGLDFYARGLRPSRALPGLGWTERLSFRYDFCKKASVPSLFWTNKNCL